MKKVLMIAYHFPPLAGSSGIQRTLRFAQQLPEFGWQPIVLTADPRAYERTSDDLLDQLPAGLVVGRRQREVEEPQLPGLGVALAHVFDPNPPLPRPADRSPGDGGPRAGRIARAGSG